MGLACVDLRPPASLAPGRFTTLLHTFQLYTGWRAANVTSVAIEEFLPSRKAAPETPAYLLTL